MILKLPSSSFLLTAYSLLQSCPIIQIPHPGATKNQLKPAGENRTTDYTDGQVGTDGMRRSGKWMNEKKTAQGEEAGERKRPTRKRVWRWLGIGVLLLVLAGLVIPFIVRDVDRSPRTKETSDIKQLLLACRLYASDWDGKFPGTLKELYPDYIDIEDSFVASNSETGKFEPYIYFPGQTDPSFPRSPLVASPFFFDGQRAVGFTGGQVVEMREEEFQQLMNARKVRPAGAAVQE